MRWIKRKPQKQRTLSSGLKTLLGPSGAAWVQAIGALLALGLTLHLAFQAKRDSQEKAVVAYRATLFAAGEAVWNVQMACDLKGRAKPWAELTGDLEDVQEIARMAAVTDLPRLLVPQLIRTRQALVTAKAIVAEMASDMAPTDRAYAACSDRMKTLQRQISTASEYLKYVD